MCKNIFWSTSKCDLSKNLGKNIDICAYACTNVLFNFIKICKIIREQNENAAKIQIVVEYENNSSI